MFLNDIDYYRRRAANEQAMAQKAERQNVAAIHHELARQYQALVDRAEVRPESGLRAPDRLSA